MPFRLSVALLPACGALLLLSAVVAQVYEWQAGEAPQQRSPVVEERVAWLSWCGARGWLTDKQVASASRRVQQSQEDVVAVLADAYRVAGGQAQWAQNEEKSQRGARQIARHVGTK